MMIGKGSLTPGGSSCLRGFWGVTGGISAVILQNKRARATRALAEDSKRGVTKTVEDVEATRALYKGKVREHSAFEKIPYQHYDYSRVGNACCENVIGYVPVPVGLAGPLIVDGVEHFIPLATTEGALVASTNRGCKALSASGGVSTALLQDGISRAPVVEMDSLESAVRLKSWVADNMDLLRKAVGKTSQYIHLSTVHTTVAGRLVYLRFVCTTGDAMGMNMISHGVEEALKLLQSEFPRLRVLAVSGNMCTDKKPAAINLIQGRGKSVVAEATISSAVCRSILKSRPQDMVRLNVAKNMIGSALAGALGGNNAHAANIVAAIFLATGQDCAHVVDSSCCLTQVDLWHPSASEDTPQETTQESDPGLLVSCTMPSLEVGVVGGGTQLAAQSGCLELLGVMKGKTGYAERSRALARLICASVLAGELSLLAALTSGDLVKSHLRLNRHKP